MDISDRLRETRDGRGLSQRDLADISGVHFNSISSIEGGKVRPRPSTLQKLAEALGVDVEDLTGAPKGDAPSAERLARTPDERRVAYLLGYLDMAKSVEERLEEAIGTGDVDMRLIDQAAELHEDLLRVTAERVELMQGLEQLPADEAKAHERLDAALNDLRSTVDQGYDAAIKTLSHRRGEVKELNRRRTDEGGTTDESRGVRSA